MCVHMSLSFCRSKSSQTKTDHVGSHHKTYSCQQGISAIRGAMHIPKYSLEAISNLIKINYQALIRPLRKQQSAY